MFSLKWCFCIWNKTAVFALTISLYLKCFLKKETQDKLFLFNILISCSDSDIEPLLFIAPSKRTQSWAQTNMFFSGREHKIFACIYSSVVWFTIQTKVKVLLNAAAGSHPLSGCLCLSLVMLGGFSLPGWKYWGQGELAGPSQTWEGLGEIQSESSGMLPGVEKPQASHLSASLLEGLLAGEESEAGVKSAWP